MTFGQPIFRAREMPPAAIAVMGPQEAMAEVIGKYLLCAIFRTRGVNGPDRDFAFTEVFNNWPDAGKDLPYPCASIGASTDTYHEDQLRPHPVEDTLGVFDCLVGYEPDPAFPKTVLWRTAQATVDFQVDVWTSSVPERQAVEARLGYLFNPGQERTGVLLGGHPSYYSRAVRVTLLSHNSIDTEDAVYPNERRLQITLRADVDVVDLRIAVLLTPRATVDATDPIDPGDQP